MGFFQWDSGKFSWFTLAIRFQGSNFENTLVRINKAVILTSNPRSFLFPATIGNEK